MDACIFSQEDESNSRGQEKGSKDVCTVQYQSTSSYCSAKILIIALALRLPKVVEKGVTYNNICVSGYESNAMEDKQSSP